MPHVRVSCSVDIDWWVAKRVGELLGGWGRRAAPGFIAVREGIPRAAPNTLLGWVGPAMCRARRSWAVAVVVRRMLLAPVTLPPVTHWGARAFVPAAPVPSRGAQA